MAESPRSSATSSAVSTAAMVAAQSVASRGNSTLPPDMLDQVARRMAIMGVATALVWILTRIIYRTGLEHQTLAPMRQVIFLCGLSLSLVMVYLARFRKLAPDSLLRLGFTFEIATAFLIAVAVQSTPLEFAHPTLGNLPVHGVSWLASWVIVYSAIVPAQPRAIFLAAILSVSMEPAWIYVDAALHSSFPDRWSALVGPPIPKPPVSSILTIYSISLLYAALAVIPSKIVLRLSQQVGRARRMGSYHLTSKLGSGGMGEVWMAHHRMLARPAAIKLVRSDLLGARSRAEAGETLQRFEREAQATASLQSPHTIQVFDFGLSDDHTFYYVMELLDGLDLDSLVRQYGPVDPARSVYMLRQACHSLADAHAIGFTHRDIKPANLFTCRLGQDYDFVKVLDFGLVKRSKANNDVTVTQEGLTGGTPAFMAPEAVLGDPIDHRADLYSLGCVGSWLLTGRLLFDEENPMKMAMAHVQEPPPAPSAASELEIPAKLDALILECLAKKPDDRPSSANEIDARLAEIEFDQPWNNDRAARWWQMHQPKRKSPTAGATEIPVSVTQLFKQDSDPD